MKRKVLGLVLLMVLMIGITKNVYANERVYYTTPNGIELTQKEYNFLNGFFGKGYVDIMTQDQYNEYLEDDIFNKEVTTVSYTEPGLALLNPNGTRSDTHTTQAKTVQIGKVCPPNYCIMTLRNTWHGDPATRSWDNIGAYLSGVTYLSHIATIVSTDNYSYSFSNLKTASNGVGNSVDLPDTGSNLIITMTFKVSKGGTVFGSYQHAMNDTTLAVSQNYNFDIGGYGGVFDYYGTAIGVYDGMNGVDITV